MAGIDSLGKDFGGMDNKFISVREYITGKWQSLQGSEIGAVVARGAGGAFTVMVLSSALAFCTNILLTRLLGVTQYGYYIYALTWINVLALISQLGMTSSLVRYIPAYNANAEWGLFRGILIHSMRYVGSASVFIGGLGSMIVWLLYDTLEPELALTFWISFLLLPLLGLTGLRQAALQAFRRVVQASLPDGIIRPMTIAIIAGALYLIIGEHLKSYQVMLMNVIGAAVAFTVGTSWLLKALPENLRTVSPVSAAKEWLKVSLPMFFIAGMYLIISQVDIIMIGALINTEQAGIYAVSTRVAQLVAFGALAANSIVAPMISELFATKRFNDLQKMMTIAARGIFTFALTISIGLIIFGDSILSLFGKEFGVGYLPLVILLLSHLSHAFIGSGGYLLTMTNYQREAALIFGLSAITNIILNFILIPDFGIVGAAVATVLTSLLWISMMLSYVWRRLNINPTVITIR